MIISNHFSEAAGPGTTFRNIIWPKEVRFLYMGTSPHSPWQAQVRFPFLLRHFSEPFRLKAMLARVWRSPDNGTQIILKYRQAGQKKWRSLSTQTLPPLPDCLQIPCKCL